MKIFVPIIPTNLVTNSLISFFALSEKQKQSSDFKQVGRLLRRYIYMLFVYSESRPTSKPCPIQ